MDISIIAVTTVILHLTFSIVSINIVIVAMDEKQNRHLREQVEQTPRIIHLNR